MAKRGELKQIVSKQTIEQYIDRLFTTDSILGNYLNYYIIK